jgi:ABC-type antimicrobial peptide transport system permease subunit
MNDYKKDLRPPRLVDRFLEWFLPEHLLEEVQGDLQEVFYKQVKVVGLKRARQAYVFTAFQYIRPYFLKRRKKSPYYTKPLYSDMLQNYFITAFRSMQRNPVYSLINLLGLTLGITCCLLIFLFVRFELSYDTYHPNAHQIYRIVTEETYPEGSAQTAGTPFPMIHAIRTDFPQLLASTPIFGMNTIIVTVPSEEKNGLPARFKEEKTAAFVEPQYFDFFDYKWISGNPKQALASPNTIVITEKIAQKYFGLQNPVGKTLILQQAGSETHAVQVSGVVKNPPANTDFPFQLFISGASFEEFRIGNPKDWRTIYGSSQIYVRLPENFLPGQLEEALVSFNKKYRTSNGAENSKFLVQPLSDIHFNELFDNYSGRAISKQILLAMGLVGLFLIVTACINFINLATAQAVKRAKEVGIRKVLGSSRGQLLGQFMGETSILTGIAILFSNVLVWLLLPLLHNLLGTQLPGSSLTEPIVWQVCGPLLVAVTLLAGFYPAVVLASYQPVRALKSKITTAHAGNFTLRRSLVVLQFTISQVLIIGTIVISAQMAYFRNAPLGFNKEAILRVPLAGNEPNQLEALRAKLTGFPGIQHVSFSLFTPSSSGNWDTVFKYDHSPDEAPFPVYMRPADTAYFSTYNLQIIAGRKYTASDTIKEFVVNETFLTKLGITDPQQVLGKDLSLNHKTGPIVGVVKDFHALSLHKETVPTALTTMRNSYSVGNIKLASAQPENIRESLAHIEKAWRETYPDGIFEYQFIDDMLASFYKKEAQIGQFFSIFAGIAIFIGCLGLYGLVSFMTAQKVKEIGVRKVLGASVTHILWLFTKEFLLLIGIAFLIAAPLAYYFMEKWLENFAYSIPFNAGYYALALGTSLCIALLTAGYKSIRAALVNPVKSLRNE